MPPKSLSDLKTNERKAVKLARIMTAESIDDTIRYLETEITRLEVEKVKTSDPSKQARITRRIARLRRELAELRRESVAADAEGALFLPPNKEILEGIKSSVASLERAVIDGENANTVLTAMDEIFVQWNSIRS